MADLPEDARTFASDLPRPEVLRQERLGDDTDFLAIAESVRQALAEARLGDAVEDCGLVVTHESPGLADHLQGFFRWREALRAWLHSPARFNPPEFLYRLKSASVYRLHSFLYIHWLSAMFRLHGFSLYNNNACASGAFALAVAADRVRNGEVPAMVVVGGDVPEDGTKYRWFRDLGLYSPSGHCRPFEAARDGLVLGSGAAAMILEDLDRAKAAGKRIWGEWLAGGFRSEGWKVTLPDVSHEHYAAAIRDALSAARVAPEELSLVVPHGVGTGLYDRFEALSLVRALGDGGRSWPPLMPLKGVLGHTLGGSVLVELAAALIALDRGEVPPLVGLEHPDPELPLGRPRRGPLPRAWTLLKCTNGFAGQNGAIVLRAAVESS
jgi:3-oxoacyl-(acyl-carrier-protein) synthase